MNRGILGAGVAVIALAAVLGGGYLYAEHRAQAQLNAVTADIRAQLGPSGSFTYKRSKIRVLSRTVIFDQVRLARADGEAATAAYLRLDGVQQHTAGTVHAEIVTLAAPQGITATASALDIKDLQVLPAPSGTPATALDNVRFSDLVLHTVASTHGSDHSMAGTVEIADYGIGRPTTTTLTNLTADVTSDSNVREHMTLASLRLAGFDLASARRQLASLPRPLDIGEKTVWLTWHAANLQAQTFTLSDPEGLLTLGGFTVNDFGGDHTTSVSFDGLQIKLNNEKDLQSLALAKLSATGLDAPAVRNLLLNKAAPRPFLGKGSTELDGLSIASSAANITLAKAMVSQVPMPGQAGANATTTVSGLSIDVLDPEAAGALNAIGINPLQLELSAQSSYLAAGGVADMPDFDLRLNNLAELQLAVRAAGVEHFYAPPDGQAEADPTDALFGMLAGIKLQSLHLRLTDQGLGDRLATFAAQQHGGTADAVRASFADTLRQSQPVPDPAVTDAVATFLTDGGALDLRMDPPAPLGLDEIFTAAQTNPDAMTAQLGLKAQGGKAVSATPFQ